MKRINPKTGKIEIKLQPKGLPVIWVELYCDRCEKFQECLGFKDLSDETWEELNQIISQTNQIPEELRRRVVQKNACNK